MADLKYYDVILKPATFLSAGISSMSPFGHAFAHAPQPAQESASTTATPFTTWIALYVHAATQEPYPKQP